MTPNPKAKTIPPRDIDGSRLWPLDNFERDFKNILKSVTAAGKSATGFNERDFLCRPGKTFTMRRVGFTFTTLKEFNTEDKDFRIPDISLALDRMLGEQRIKIATPKGPFFIFHDSVPGCDYEQDIPESKANASVNLSRPRQREEDLLQTWEVANRARFLQSLRERPLKNGFEKAAWPPRQSENIRSLADEFFNAEQDYDRDDDAVVETPNWARSMLPGLRYYPLLPGTPIGVKGLEDLKAIVKTMTARPENIAMILQDQPVVAVCAGKKKKETFFAEPEFFMLSPVFYKDFENSLGIIQKEMKFGNWKPQNPYQAGRSNRRLERTLCIVRKNGEIQFIAIAARPDEAIRNILEKSAKAGLDQYRLKPGENEIELSANGRAVQRGWWNELPGFRNIALIKATDMTRATTIRQLLSESPAVMGGKFASRALNVEPVCIMLPITALHYFKKALSVARIIVPSSEWAHKNPYLGAQFESADKKQFANSIHIVCQNARKDFIALPAEPSPVIRRIVRRMADDGLLSTPVILAPETAPVLEP